MIPADFPLRFIAGRRVRAHLRAHGFRLQDFPTLLGAAGGPKWLVLYGLDRELAPRLQQAGGRHDLLGASIGAWRMAAYAQQEPVAALDRLAAGYTGEELFSGARLDMTQVFQRWCQALLGPAAGRDLLASEQLALHVLVTWYPASRWPGMLRLGRLVLTNLVGRQFMERHGGHRLVLSSRPTVPVRAWEAASETAAASLRPPLQAPLTEANMVPALLASAAVPGFIRPVPGLLADRPGFGLDGGLIDYHFDDAPARDRFVLYPHFYPHMVPGWFDKPLRRRWLDPRQLDNVLLVAPTAAFVAGLPGGKLPDRGDPRRLGLARCQADWEVVARASLALGDALQQALDHDWVPELVDREATPDG